MTHLNNNATEVATDKNNTVESASFYQYLIKSKSSQEVQAVLTLYGNFQEDFSFNKESIPMVEFNRYFEQEMLWNDTYASVLEAFGKACIDITDLVIINHQQFQIPVRDEETIGTLHSMTDDVFRTKETTLFSLTPTWDLGLEK